jgi:hypothetical protein
MSGRPVRWFDLPEYRESKGEHELDILEVQNIRSISIRDQVSAQELAQILQEAGEGYRRACGKGTSAIQECQYHQLFQLSPEDQQKLREVSCFVV